MNDQEFRSLVADLRKAQKAWFKNHQQSDLIESKRLEKAVDAELSSPGQQEMFGDER